MSGCGVSITSLDIVPPVLGVDALTVLPLGESIAEAEDLDLSVSLTALITYVCQECCPVSRFRIRRPTLRLCGPFGSVGCTSKRPLFVSRSSRPVSMLMEQRLNPFCPRYAGSQHRLNPYLLHTQSATRLVPAFSRRDNAIIFRVV